MEEQQFFFCKQHYKLDVFSFLISLHQPTQMLEGSNWMQMSSNLKSFLWKTVHENFWLDPWGTFFLPVKSTSEVCFFWPIHPYHGEHHGCIHIPFGAIRVLDPSETSRFSAPKALHSLSKKETPLGENAGENLENLEGCKFRRLEASLFRKGDAVMTIFCVSCCRDQREVQYGRSSLPYVLFFFVETLLQGGFPAKTMVNVRVVLTWFNQVNDEQLVGGRGGKWSL